MPRFPTLMVGRLLLVVCAWGLPLGAHAERYALLVGVTEYQHLPRDKHLAGSRKDIPALREVLVQRGFAPTRIRVVADGMAEASTPTRANVLAALTSLSKTVVRGDFVFVYFAGHGSQAPTTAAVPAIHRRPDGRQQIFLPRDVSNWDDGLRVVPNAIYDYELTAAVSAIRTRGAFVWAVFDSCHSATLVRGESKVAGEVTREVEPKELGIPDSAFRGPEDLSGGSTRGPADPPARDLEAADPHAGGYVAFYAAQRGESTVEGLHPEGAADRAVRGLFSYWFTRALAGADAVTYRQLGESVYQSYVAIPRLSPTPMITGTHLDAPIFGDKPGQRVLQWPVADAGPAGWMLRAGQLHQVGAGSILALVPSPIAKDSEALGYVKVQEARTMEALVVPFAHRGKAAPEKLPPGAYARLVSPAVDFTLRVALPDGRSAAAARDFAKVLRAVQATWPAGRKVSWVRAEETHDVRLELADGAVWVIPAGLKRTVSGPSASVRFDTAAAATPAELRLELLTVAKALNLQRIAAIHATTSDPDIKISMEVLRKDRSMSMDGGPVFQLEVGDKFVITISNLRERVALDVTALYVDEHQHLQALDFGTAGEPGRCDAKANDKGTPACQVQTGFRVTAPAASPERFVLIVVDAQSGAPPHDFRYLAKPELEAERGASDDVQSLLDEAGFGSHAEAGTRSGPAPVPTKMRVRTFTFRIK